MMSIKQWHPSSSTLVLIANAHFSDSPHFRDVLRKEHALIAVDGGLRHCKRLGIIPELIIGDFDSASSILRSHYSSTPQLETPDPNKTDLEKALEYLIGFNPIRIIVFAALGNRIDHTLTNICLLTRYPAKVIFETDQEKIWALEKNTVLNCQPGQQLSLIPFNGEVTGVTTRGLRWNLDKGTLNKQFVGISNVCIEKDVLIEHQTGDLVLCLHY